MSFDEKCEAIIRLQTKRERNSAASALLQELDPLDPEAWHSDADKVLLALLRAEGYGEIVDTFDAAERWYA